jgi:four helix bundle suffix protein
MKSEITLLDVARMSLEELIEDYEDFLRENKLKIWTKTDPRIENIKKRAYQLTSVNNLQEDGQFNVKPKLPEKAEIAANILLTLCHQATFPLFKQIKSVENKIITEGGFTENLTRKSEEFLNKTHPAKEASVA